MGLDAQIENASRYIFWLDGVERHQRWEPNCCARCLWRGMRVMIWLGVVERHQRWEQAWHARRWLFSIQIDDDVDTKSPEQKMCGSGGFLLDSSGAERAQTVVWRQWLDVEKYRRHLAKRGYCRVLRWCWRSLLTWRSDGRQKVNYTYGVTMYKWEQLC